MHLRYDLTGKTFGKLVVIEQGWNEETQRSGWKCECVCGKTTLVPGTRLRLGKTTSCGCAHGALIGASRRTHGMSRTPEFRAFQSAKGRCTKTTYVQYPSYGGRGIKFLYGSFEDFFKDIGLRPSKEYSLDRINNDGNYEIGNCRWSNPIIQSNNQRERKRLDQFSTKELMSELKRRGN